MAINKRKLLASAQKNLQKGSLDKALRDYLAILEADPRDTNVRLKVGDLQLRRGSRDEALGAYRKVADQFMRDGFDAKAVALYKQITKLDPKQYDSYVPLADLYHRLGLTSDAMNALQTAADALNREGRKREALEVLRRMASLDPSNTTSRLKIAELLRQAGLTDEAVSEYEEAANELDRQGDWEGRLAVLERILELRPTHPRALEGLARTLVQRGRSDRAEHFARRLVEADPDRPEHYETLAAVYVGMEREDAVAEVYRQLAELYRARGDEDKAREIHQRFAPPEPIQISEDTGPGADAFVELPGADAEPAPELAADASGASPEPASDEGVATSAAPGDGDPDQLVAEAGVYLRYGKHERAIASLEAVLEQSPSHAAALEKLGEVCAATGDATRAVECYVRAADQASAEGDAERFELLRSRIAALDPEAAEEIATLAPAVPPPDVESELIPDEEPAAAAPPAALDEIEIEIEEDSFSEAAAAPDEGAAAADAAAAPLPQAEPSAPAAARAPEETEPDTGSAANQIVEELEEANFYFAQGLLDEAEATYQRILRLAPNHPQALLRLGEIEAARGQHAVETAPAAEIETEAPAAPGPASEQAPGEPAQPSDAEMPALEVTGNLTLTLDDLEADADVTAATPDEEGDAEAELFASLPDEDALAASLAQGDDIASLDEQDAAVAADVAGADESTEDAVVAADAEAPAPAEPAEATFDLREALAGVFDEDGAAAAPSTDEEAFDSIFQEFKRGVSQTLDDGDFETRYDLGIAYREMGLYEDALSEFQIVLDSPSRRLDALQMMGLCALDLKRPGDAVANFEQALSSPDVPTEREIALRFDLGRACEAQGASDRALDAFRRVAAMNPDFQDVAARLGAMERAQAAGAPAPEAETYESFDDLVAEGEVAEVHAEAMVEDASEAMDGIEDAVVAADASAIAPAAVEIEAPSDVSVEVESAPVEEPAVEAPVEPAVEAAAAAEVSETIAEASGEGFELEVEAPALESPEPSVEEVAGEDASASGDVEAASDASGELEPPAVELTDALDPSDGGSDALQAAAAEASEAIPSEPEPALPIELEPLELELPIHPDGETASAAASEALEPALDVEASVAAGASEAETKLPPELAEGVPRSEPQAPPEAEANAEAASPAAAQPDETPAPPETPQPPPAPRRRRRKISFV